MRSVNRLFVEDCQSFFAVIGGFMYSMYRVV